MLVRKIPFFGSKRCGNKSAILFGFQLRWIDFRNPPWHRWAPPGRPANTHLTRPICRLAQVPERSRFGLPSLGRNNYAACTGDSSYRSRDSVPDVNELQRSNTVLRSRHGEHNSASIATRLTGVCRFDTSIEGSVTRFGTGWPIDAWRRNRDRFR